MIQHRVNAGRQRTPAGLATSVGLGLLGLAGLVTPLAAETLEVPGEYATIQAAIDAAAPGDRILVSPGTYLERISFNGKGVKVDAVGSACDTTIDGTGGTSYLSVVNGDGEPSSARIQGFTITGGTAAGGAGISVINDSRLRILNCIVVSNASSADGGGVFSNESRPVVRDTEFLNNTADSEGGGAIIWGGSPTFERCVFEGNTSGASGGGMSVSFDSDTELIGCRFRDNEGTLGGGLVIWNSPVDVVGCTFSGNLGTSTGGAVQINSGQPLLVNCLIYENESPYGGGILASNLSNATIVNCTIADNDATGPAPLNPGGGIYTITPTLTVRNCVLWGNAPDQIGGTSTAMDAALVQYCTVQGGWPGTGNQSSNPDFVAAGQDNYRLEVGSPAIDGGRNSYLPADEWDLDDDGNTTEKIPYDITGIRRRVGTVDMGAYECLVDPCTGACVEVLVDCNGNDVPDACDIAQGSSVDCNGNGVPDECEAGATMEIVFIIDGSGSIDEDEWTLQKDGIADCICGPGAIIPADGTATVTVIQFSDEECDAIPPTTIGSAGGASTLCDRVDELGQVEGGTNLVPALERAQDLFLASDAALRHIFISTDAGVSDPAESLDLCDIIRGELGVRICTALVDDGACPQSNDFLEDCANVDGSRPGPQGSYVCGDAAADIGALCSSCIELFEDCDGNGVPDECQPDCDGDGVIDPCEADTNGNGIPDDCECLGDANGDGTVNVQDLLLVLSGWGECPPDPPCSGDVTGDGLVDVNDLLLVISNWDCVAP